jgi:hypothetical protein
MVGVPKQGFPIFGGYVEGAHLSQAKRIRLEQNGILRWMTVGAPES